MAYSCLAATIESTRAYLRLLRKRRKAITIRAMANKPPSTAIPAINPVLLEAGAGLDDAVEEAAPPLTELLEESDVGVARDGDGDVPWGDDEAFVFDDDNDGKTPAEVWLGVWVALGEGLEDSCCPWLVSGARPTVFCI